MEIALPGDPADMLKAIRHILDYFVFHEALDVSTIKHRYHFFWDWSAGRSGSRE
jgi:hypothetical protein